MPEVSGYLDSGITNIPELTSAMQQALINEPNNKPT